MALSTTSLSNAVTARQKYVVLASATNLAVGDLLRVDDEFMRVGKEWESGTTVHVERGINGTAAVAHVASAPVTRGTPKDDWPVPAPGQYLILPPTGRAIRAVSYSAAGAIALPQTPNEELQVTLIGTALAMTLADPDEAINGALLRISSNQGAAHTVTSASGFGGAGSSYDVLTFDGTGVASVLARAVDGVWVLEGQVDGTLTQVATSIA